MSPDNGLRGPVLEFQGELGSDQVAEVILPRRMAQAVLDLKLSVSCEAKSNGCIDAGSVIAPSRRRFAAVGNA